MLAALRSQLLRRSVARTASWLRADHPPVGVTRQTHKRRPGTTDAKDIALDAPSAFVIEFAG